MKKLLPVFIVIFALAFVFAGVMLVRELTQREKEISEFQELAELVAVPRLTTPERETPDGEEATSPAGQPQTEQKPQTSEKPQSGSKTQPVVRNLQPLFERNSDCVGWVYIADTKINYPVMHTPREPERYLKKNFDGKRSAAGVPFLEGLCTLRSDNLIIYGHNMKNGTMFAGITKYKNESYWQTHPTIEFETADGVRQYQIFAAVRLKMDDGWYDFRIAKTEEEHLRQVTRIKEMALYDTGITPAYGQQMITLSTCHGAKDEDRMILIAVEIN